ncbi:Transcriptional regulator ovo-like 1 [Homarus americanus]|uniref:Transcriptional regulator ovo-like 1 n=2 Tax=Homarus americanus TaxID=6706 RepID=A0A8J5JHR3_HOMAM|nr:Transcriptional regulator ovo-like 1 [Homarus americanus]
MDHQPLASVTTGSLSPELQTTSSRKHDLPSVIDLRPVDAGIRPISEEIQPVQEDLHHVTQDMHRVGGQLHQVNSSMSVNGEELRLTDSDIHQVSNDHTQVSDPLAINNEDALTMDGEITDMDPNQDVQVITHQANLLEDASGVLSADKTIKLPSFPSQQTAHEAHDPQDLQLSSITSGGGALPLDTQHYYDSLHPAPIMVYEVPAGNIVPFDSIVPVPLPKGIGEKNNEGVDLLQASVNETVYTHPTQEMSHPLYVLHHPQKKEPSSEGMVIEHINAGDGVSPNIVLENRDGSTFTKVGDQSSNMMPIGTEFSLISTSCYDNSVTTVANMAQLSMSAVYHTSTDTDSEVALTLASLGNPKIEKMDRDCGQNQNTEHSDVMRAASIISGVTDHQQFDNMDHQSSKTLEEEIRTKKDQKPTLVLRSRRSRGTTPNQQHHDMTIDDTKKVSKRKKKRETKLAPFPKTEEGENFIIPDSVLSVRQISGPSITMQNESQKENLLGQLLKASEHCEPATLIPEGVVDDVIPAVGYRIMDMTNLSEMIGMMHRCTGSMGAIVIQEQASLREGAVSQLSVICTGCQEGAVCATSNRTSATGPWDINARVEQLTKEFNIKEDQVQRMLEILGIFYRPCDPSLQPMSQPMEMETAPVQVAKKKRKKKSDSDSSGKPKNVACTVCKERFVGENHLKKHMNCHDLSLHTCPYCHAYFKKPFNLKQHIKKHENCKYECNQCQRVFTDKSTLLCHIRSQHEKR